MKIIFFGSDDFAGMHMEALIKSSHQVVAAVTQPDKAKGRGMKVVFSPIKELAVKYKIPLLQPETLKDPQIVAELKSFQADLFVVIAYGKILPQEVLDIPKIMPINVHGSLLPKYRGAAPINFAVMNGDEVTGLTIIKMNAAMDAGEIIAQHEMGIRPIDDASTLRIKMMQQGKEFLVKTVDQIAQGKFSLIPQDETKVTLASKLTKGMSKIDWKQPAVIIHNQVRGLQPWPGASTFYQGKQLKIYSTSVIPDETQAACGEIISADKNGVVVKAGEGAVLIGEIQLEGGTKMTAQQYLVGHSLPKGSILE